MSMKKKKTVGTAVAAVVALAIAGFSVTEILEYLSVFRNRVRAVVREEIPLSVEIERMEVLIEKLDTQVDDQKQVVARAKVALEDAEAQHQKAQSVCGRLLSDMQYLRSLTSVDGTPTCKTMTVGYQEVSSEDVHRALAHKLAAWKSATNTASAREEGLAQQRAAFAKLEQQFADWQSQRELLKQRLDTLKVRNQTQNLAVETDTSVFNNADLARATELADEIEHELRIVEAQQDLDTDVADLILPRPDVSNGEEALISEVDELLNAQREGSTL